MWFIPCTFAHIIILFDFLIYRIALLEYMNDLNAKHEKMGEIDELAVGNSENAILYSEEDFVGGEPWLFYLFLFLVISSINTVVIGN